MWIVNDTEITVCEGDYGVKLPLTIKDITFAQNDVVLFTLKKSANNTAILTKSFTNVQQNTVSLELTEADSQLLKNGTYIYTLDWYQDGAFMCNIIRDGVFKVVDKP